MTARLKGFTLVELLIVIALLGVIALIVIAAINPIEQANRARDTRFKADGAQLISAIDRYFVAQNKFPWVAGAITNDSPYGFVSADDTGIGICADASCNPGVLITTDELKTEFANRDFIGATAVEEQLMLGKDQGTSESVYACYIPLSKATRDAAVADGQVYHVNPDGTKPATVDCDAVGANWVTLACYVCVPE